MLSTQNVQNNRLVVYFFRGLPAQQMNVTPILASMPLKVMLRCPEPRLSLLKVWSFFDFWADSEAMWKGYYVVNNGSDALTQAVGQRVRRSA